MRNFYLLCDYIIRTSYSVTTLYSVLHSSYVFHEFAIGFLSKPILHCPEEMANAGPVLGNRLSSPSMRLVSHFNLDMVSAYNASAQAARLEVIHISFIDCLGFPLFLHCFSCLPQLDTPTLDCLLLHITALLSLLLRST
jgi:hypothetical protein